MNTYTSTKQIHGSTTDIACTNRTGVLRRMLAGSLLAMAIAAPASIGLAAAAHADDDAPTPDIQPIPAFTVQTPPVPWLGLPAIPGLGLIDPGCRVQLYYFNGSVHCG
ncbi:MAG: hypothetical protein ACLPXZ_23060 [Mycobacterium sp.]